jgi:2-methylisocitrate lyase-like PEP mutase family enzyme
MHEERRVMSASKITVRQQLRRRLTEGGTIVAPGIYDAYGARMVQQAG